MSRRHWTTRDNRRATTPMPRRISPGSSPHGERPGGDASISVMTRSILPLCLRPIKKVVAPLPDEWLIAKHVHSAFIGTDLEARLRGAGITTLVVTGLVANHCVESTARMASNLGFDTYVVGDATAAYDGTGLDGTHYAADTIHAMTLMNLHKEFATITTTDEVLAAMTTG